MASTYLVPPRSPWLWSADTTGVHPTPLNDRYVGDGSTTWIRDQICSLSSGVIAATESDGGAGVAGNVDTDNIAAGTKIFLAGTTEAAATSEIVPVTPITNDLVFIGYLLSSDAAGEAPPTAPTSIVGSSYALYYDANGQWGVNKNVTAKALVEIVAVESQLLPFIPAGIDSTYNLVAFKFLSTVIY